MCACAHVEAANGWHCLQSVETFSAALGEGLAHFLAMTAFNDPTNPTQAWFGYYKEVLGPDEILSIPAGYCESRPDLCTPSLTNPDIRVALPPVPLNAAAAYKLRNNQCSLPDGTTVALGTLATEHDFLQFFHAVHTQGAALSLAEIYSILRTSCNGRQNECDATGACSPCTGSDPTQCTSCGGVCTNVACDDSNEPTSCGRPCYPGSLDVDRTIPPDYLRWDPILPIHLDGMDDPSDPNDDDVFASEVSLVDGARRYLDQKYGVGSDQLRDFQNRGVDHGLTKDLTP